MAPCCTCNGKSAVCKRCVCVRSGCPCVSCLPLRELRCSNSLQHRQHSSAESRGEVRDNSNPCVDVASTGISAASSEDTSPQVHLVILLIAVCC